MKLQRLSNSPVLSPVRLRSWEASAVYNCAAIRHRGLVHLVYRATDIASGGQEGPYISNLGYAVSVDGIHFNRLEQPILRNDVDQELRGPEDPRIVFVDNAFYMTYTGYGGRFDGDYRICLASSANLIDWERHGVLLDESNKDAALFPERVSGWHLMLHRRPPDIWLAYSENLLNWYDHQLIMKVKPDSDWENIKIGAAGPPILVPDGWLLIYHGVGQGRRYSLGAALLDHNDPTKVLARQADPILVPELDWETEGHVPNVVFSCGQVVMGNDLYVYYGAADTCIGVAAMSLGDLDFG